MVLNIHRCMLLSKLLIIYFITMLLILFESILKVSNLQILDKTSISNTVDQVGIHIEYH